MFNLFVTWNKKYLYKIQPGNGKFVEVSAGNRRILERVPAKPQIPCRVERGYPGSCRESNRQGG